MNVKATRQNELGSISVNSTIWMSSWKRLVHPGLDAKEKLRVGVS